MQLLAVSVFPYSYWTVWRTAGKCLALAWVHFKSANCIYGAVLRVTFKDVPAHYAATSWLLGHAPYFEDAVSAAWIEGGVFFIGFKDVDVVVVSVWDLFTRQELVFPNYVASYMVVSWAADKLGLLIGFQNS